MSTFWFGFTWTACWGVPILLWFGASWIYENGRESGYEDGRDSRDAEVAELRRQIDHYEEVADARRE